MKDAAFPATTDPLALRADRPEPDTPDDIYRWAVKQADHIRAGRFDLLDRVLVADEIEDVARREYEALVGDLRVTLLHMLKWDHQATLRSRSWEASIREHRRRILRRLAASPSLKARLVEATSAAFEDGKDQASAETQLSIQRFPDSCPYTWVDIIERPFVLDQG